MKQILFAFLLILQMTPLKAAEILGQSQGEWKWQRPEENGAAPPVALSATATSTWRKGIAFNVSTPGLYDIISTAAPGWNNFTILYDGATIGGLSNAMMANDDLGSSFISGFKGVYLKDKALFNSNQYYLLVTTGKTNNDFGSYSLKVTGPGAVKFYPFGVPEPSTWVLLILGVGIIGAELRRRSSSKGADELPCNWN
ncbi:MAG: PEPxxWA-CTERM sorting domain-containing protein [Pseudomonadota bacterium]